MLTHVNRNTDRGYKMCKCNQCGTRAQCTPSFDFYTKPEDDPLKDTQRGAPLYCESCVVAGRNVVIVKGDNHAL